jgi:L-fuculose-phosphate aldolase
VNHLHPAEQLVQVMDRIYRQGLTTTSGGNLSILDERGHLWITPSGVDKGALTPRDIVRVAPGGTATGPHRPSVELPFHQLIYRARPELRAVVHAHPAALVAWSLVRRAPDPALLAGTRRACGAVGMAPYGLPGSAALGEQIGRVFAAGCDAVMLENHGAVVGGPDLARAFMAFEALDHCARVGIDALRLSARSGHPPTALTPAQLDRAERAEPALEELAGRDHGSEERRARMEVIALVRRACERGLFSAEGGSLSLRLDHGAFLVTPAGLDRARLEPGDLVRVEAGRREAGKRPDPSVLLHAAILARQPHVASVILAHPPSLSAFAVAGVPLDTRTIPECYIVLRDVPTLPFEATFEDLDATAARFTPASPVALVRNEGVIATGQSLIQAFDRLEVAEHGARGLVACRTLGEVVMIDDAQVRDIEKAFAL